jgi:hypothetical protein
MRKIPQTSRGRQNYQERTMKALSEYIVMSCIEAVGAMLAVTTPIKFERMDDSEVCSRIILVFIVMFLTRYGLPELEPLWTEYFSWWYILGYASFISFLSVRKCISTVRYDREAAIQKEKNSAWQPYTSGVDFTGRVNIELKNGTIIWNVDSSKLIEMGAEIKKWMAKR